MCLFVPLLSLFVWFVCLAIVCLNVLNRWFSLTSYWSFSSNSGWLPLLFSAAPDLRHCLLHVLVSCVCAWTVCVLAVCAWVCVQSFAQVQLVFFFFFMLAVVWSSSVWMKECIWLVRCCWLFCDVCMGGESGGIWRRGAPDDLAESPIIEAKSKKQKAENGSKHTCTYTTL